MSIEKRIHANFKVASSIDQRSKFASFEPEAYVPPEIQDFINTVRPDPRYCYMHTIAMSDGPTYGSNLNGDIFRADELLGMQEPDEVEKNVDQLRGLSVPRYKTFETAKFFHHHANSDYDPWFGDVPLAAWNIPMRRVELIIRIHRDRDPRSASIIDDGGIIPVSMGCRIHHERCIYCGHENEFTSQRCSHLRDLMNEIMPDGRLIAADNFKPRFFDISKVTIPADPIALSQGKVASRGFVSMSLSKNTAYDILDRTKTAAWRIKWSEIDKEVGGTTVNDLRPENRPAMQADTEPEPFSSDELKQMIEQCGGDINEVISTLAASGVVLSPAELSQLTIHATEHGDEDALQKDAELVAPVRVSLDNFSNALYHAHLTKISARSGFVTSSPLSGWEPQKMASQGAPEEVVDLYSYYRRLISSFSLDGFQKSAHLNPALRTLIAPEGSPDPNRVQAAMYYLAFAGIATD